jgi:hypothetical protein
MEQIAVLENVGTVAQVESEADGMMLLLLVLEGC